MTGLDSIARDFIVLVHPQWSGCISDVRSVVMGKTFKNEQLGIELDDFDVISNDEFRQFLPFVLAAVIGCPIDVQENYSIERFLRRPYSEFLYRDGQNLALVEEQRIRNEINISWRSPTLDGLSSEEIERSTDLCQRILDLPDELCPFREEIEDLSKCLEMAHRSTRCA